MYAASGIKLLLSVFGATDHPIAAGLTASNLVTKISNYVTTYNYDGVDIDWEETSYFDYDNGIGEEWLIELTSGLRTSLGNQYIITHAPQAPYLGAINYAYQNGGGYLYIHQEVGDDIDWYNVQFYNQGSTPYQTFNELFVSSGGWASNTAIFEIIDGSNTFSKSIPAEKLVIGKIFNIIHSFS